MESPPPLVIVTARLRLVAAGAELARADATDRRRLAALLNARLGRGWPPPLTEDTHEFTAHTLEADPGAAGWWSWYLILRDGDVAIGQAGFKGWPRDGEVEVGYSVLPDHQRNGYAPEAVTALIAWAFSHPEVQRVIAHTLPHLTASLRVMVRCGMRWRAITTEDGVEVVRYAIDRSALRDGERGAG